MATTRDTLEARTASGSTPDIYTLCVYLLAYAPSPSTLRRRREGKKKTLKQCDEGGLVYARREPLASSALSPLGKRVELRTLTVSYARAPFSAAVQTEPAGGHKSTLPFGHSLDKPSSSERRRTRCCIARPDRRAGRPSEEHTNRLLCRRTTCPRRPFQR